MNLKKLPRRVKFLIAFLVPTAIALILINCLDNDSWDVLAQGRYITEHGVYYEDVLSMHEGLHTVVQNYAFSVAFYLIYSAFGAPGIYIAMLLLNVVVIFLIYKICMLLSNKNTTLSLIVAAVTDGMLAMSGFITTRAQMLDYVVLLALIYVLELFFKTNRAKYLWWIPAFSLFLTNFHASVWWMIFAFMIAYGLDMMIRQIKFKKKYNWKIYIGVFVISAVVGVINPYGIEMITSIFEGYGGLASAGVVQELQSFNPMAEDNMIAYIGLILAMVLYIYGERKMRFRHLLLFLGFLTMGLISVKGLSELILVMFIPLAFIYKDLKIPQFLNKKKIGRAMLYWTGIFVSGITLAAMVWVVSDFPNYPSIEMKEIMDIIDEKTDGLDKRSLKIYVGYNQGGYVEFRGYPAYLDPRGGDFTKVVNKKEDILGEWIDLRNGNLEMKDFLSKYDFDFLVVDKNGDGIPTEKIDERYVLIYGDEDAPYQLFEKAQGS